MSKKLKQRVRALELKIEVLTTLIDGYAEAYAKANVRPAHPSLQPVTMLSEDEARTALEAFYEKYPHFRPNRLIYVSMDDERAMTAAVREVLVEDSKKNHPSNAPSCSCYSDGIPDPDCPTHGRSEDDQAIPTPEHPTPDAGPA